MASPVKWTFAYLRIVVNRKHSSLNQVQKLIKITMLESKIEFFVGYLYLRSAISPGD